MRTVRVKMMVKVRVNCYPKEARNESVGCDCW